MFLTDFLVELKSIDTVSDNVQDLNVRLVQGDLEEYPAIIYNISNEGSPISVAGSTSLTEYLIEISVFADTLTAGITIANGITSHFSGFTGVINSSASDGGSFISRSVLNDMRQRFENNVRSTYVVELEFIMFSKKGV